MSSRFLHSFIVWGNSVSSFPAKGNFCSFVSFPMESGNFLSLLSVRISQLIPSGKMSSSNSSILFALKPSIVRFSHSLNAEGIGTAYALYDIAKEKKTLSSYCKRSVRTS